MAQTATNAAERELVLTRIIDAPRELVFRMWTDPVHLAKWWGPRDFTNPVCEIDFRPGGALRIVMRAPGGIDYPMGGVFREIIEPERLVFTNCALDSDGNVLLDGVTVVTFVEEGGKTKLTVQTHAVALVPAAVRYLEGMQAGWEQTLDGLEQHAQDTAARELVITRVIDAPRELVFEAWTDPKHLAQWWGPNGFSTTTRSFDFRPGGVWRFVMHGPDGRDYQNCITWDEIARPERLAYRHGGDEGVEPVKFRTVVTFEEVGGKTRLTLRAVFPSADERDRVVRDYGAEEGAKQTVARLAEYVVWTETKRDEELELTVTRVFDAPRETVFRAWTDPKQAALWWGPQGFTTISCEMDVRPGGAYRACMRSPEGTRHCRRGVYREVVTPERLVFTFAWEDANGNPGHEMVVTVTFAEIGGKTELSLHQAAFETAGARDAHHAGWSSCMERFAEYLAAHSQGKAKP
jgi:uncharacterized protein YndB with AHSA1/START domain